MLKVSEIFVSIQGEGIDVGRVASFIRFTGCPLKCRFCDTQYAKTGGSLFSIEELIFRLEKLGFSDIVVTGGEPLVQDEIESFIVELSKKDWVRKIFIETCGIFFKKDVFTDKVFLNISPKPPSMMDIDAKRLLDGYISLFPDRVNVKFLFANEKDFLFAMDIVNENIDFFQKNGIVFQPVELPGEDYVESVRKVIDFIKRNKAVVSKFEVKIIPQIHKLLGIK